MVVKVLLFGPYAAALGARECMVRLGGDHSCAGVLAGLAAEQPELSRLLPGARLAINGEFAAAERPVTASDELALIGLVSGG